MLIGLLWVPAARAVVFTSGDSNVISLPWQNADEIAVADFNGDGHPDFAVAGVTGASSGSDPISGTVSAFLGNGGGDFAVTPGSPIDLGTVESRPVYEDYEEVVTADVNGDGHADLVVGNNGNDSLAVLLGDGSGGFASASGSPLTLPYAPVALAVGDFNGDGHRDVAVLTTDATVAVLLGDGNGGFTQVSSLNVYNDTTRNQPAGAVVVADFNGDGTADLAVTYGEDVSVWLGDGTGQFGEASGFPYRLQPSDSFWIPTKLAAGDFNNDGHPDLAAFDVYHHTLTVLLNDGSAGFAPTSASPMADLGGEFESAVPVADFNGDGNLDLVTDDGGNPTLLLGDGTGGFSVADGLPFADIWPGPFDVAVDVNGDGHPDLLGRVSSGVRVGALVSSPPSTSITSGPDSVTHATTAAFGVSSDDTPVRYQCKLDGSGWSACASPDYSGLSTGSHTLAVRAVDTEERWADPTPATRTWTIDNSKPPVAALDVAPSPVLTGSKITLDASASHDSLDGSIVDYQWDLGNGRFSEDTGSTPTTTARFSTPGPETVRVKVTNNVGGSAIASATVDPRPVPPVGPVGISIDNGAYATNDPEVQLNIVWPAFASQALISNDGGFGAAGGTTTVPLAATIAWTLRAQSGERLLSKTVYLRFSDSATPLSTFTDDIVLDTTTPVVTEATSAGVLGHRYRVRLRATEKLSGISITQFSTAEHGGAEVVLKSPMVRGITKLARVVAVRMRGEPRWVRVRSAAGTWSRWHRIG